MNQSGISKKEAYSAKPEPGKIHISFSEFRLYSECGHRHLIEKYLKIVEPSTSIHLFFGSAIHEALELGMKQQINVEGRIAHFRQFFIKEMNDNLKDSQDYTWLEDFLVQGQNILKYVSTEKIIEKYEVVGVEIPVYEPLYKNYYFKGFIDLVLRDRKTGRYIVIDWKTSGEAWKVEKKKEDSIFVSHMRFYKYFYGRKYNIPFDNIDCKYIVLNRLKNKKDTSQGFGKMQPVDMDFDLNDIKISLKGLAKAMRDIHIKNHFSKIKLVKNSKSGCFFCPYKYGHWLCNSNPLQYKDLLREYKKEN